MRTSSEATPGNRTGTSAMILSRKFLSIGKCSGLRSRKERMSDLIEIASKYNDDSVRLSHLLFHTSCSPKWGTVNGKIKWPGYGI